MLVPPQEMVVTLGHIFPPNRPRVNSHIQAFEIKWHFMISGGSSPCLPKAAPDKSIAYKDQRCFSSHPLSKLFLEILTSLVKNRLCRMSAELLRLLSSVQHVRDQLKEMEGVPVLLSLLHSRNLKLLWSVTWVVVQLCEDPDCRAEIRGWGGVQQLLRLLNIDRQHVADRSAIEMPPTPSNAPQFPGEHMSEGLGPHETVQKTVALQSGQRPHRAEYHTMCPK
ncbi:hypothetical protein GOODEAATRI_006683 [Goodea atripinnis]|uniref:Uncharacterized protein n=1 Tax=Goodea atripinnis TaxID=208336 RepID=A0ABV0MFM7_9TELE